jgi:hypothetical protein
VAHRTEGTRSSGKLLFGHAQPCFSLKMVLSVRYLWNDGEIIEMIKRSDITECHQI